MRPFMIIEREHKAPTGFESITDVVREYKKPEHLWKQGLDGSGPAESKIEKAAEVIDDYSEYVAKHGCHFTKELAEHAIKLLVNANGNTHIWTVHQVNAVLKSLNLSVEHSLMNINDVAYLANMYYSDFYPQIIQDETTCLKMAHAMATDPDGYEGMAFSRWCADIMQKGINIDWKQFI